MDIKIEEIMSGKEKAVPETEEEQLAVAKMIYEYATSHPLMDETIDNMLSYTTNMNNRPATILMNKLVNFSSTFRNKIVGKILWEVWKNKFHDYVMNNKNDHEWKDAKW